MVILILIAIHGEGKSTADGTRQGRVLYPTPEICIYGQLMANRLVSLLSSFSIAILYLLVSILMR